MSGFMKPLTTAAARPNSALGKAKAPHNHSLSTDAFKNYKKNQDQASILYYWIGEETFDKVDQKRMIQAIRRLGIKDKIIRIIEAIYIEPIFSIKEGNKPNKRKKTIGGNQTGVPTFTLPLHHCYACPLPRCA